MTSRQAYPRWLMCAAMAILLLAMSGCATIQSPQRANLDAIDAQMQACAVWFKNLDDTVAAAGVADIGARRIGGFPYLRSDRFAAALGSLALENAQDFDAWVARLRSLDVDGRQVEISNLPDASIDRLGMVDRAAVLARSTECAARLAAADLSDPAARELLVSRAQVKDDYSTIKRFVGLYAIAKWPFSQGIQAWQRETTLSFEAARAGQPPQHSSARYVPPAVDTYSRAEVAVLLERAAGRPFGVAEFSDTERERLFATYAPILDIETAGDYDRIGAMRWGASVSPEIDTSQPTVYRRLAYTRVSDRSLLQLVYSAWLPARPKKHLFDLLGGQLDGIVWRVTIAPDGEPVLFDSIHPCGCFHMFFPTPRAQVLPSPGGCIEWAFSPAAAPALRDGEHMVLSVQTRTHYLSNVSAEQAANGVAYAFADYDALRSLPLPGGGTKSAFGPDALVPGTQRGERFLFWPMGIDSPGAMRQWGAHATAFVGRRHFDDADLIEQRFRLLD